MSTLSDPRLQLVPAGPRPRAWLFALGVAAPVLFSAGALAWSAFDAAPDRLVGNSWPLTWAVTVGGIALVALAIWALLAKAMSRHALALDGDVLSVRSSFYRTRLALAELDLERARVVDLDEHTELRPLVKSNGYSVPGFKSGWFRLRNRRRTFLAITDGRWKLWLPSRGGKYDLLIEPRDPHALLHALRELAAAASRR